MEVLRSARELSAGPLNKAALAMQRYTQALKDATAQRNFHIQRLRQEIRHCKGQQVALKIEQKEDRVEDTQDIMLEIQRQQLEQQQRLNEEQIWQQDLIN